MKFLAKAGNVWLTITLVGCYTQIFPPKEPYVPGVSTTEALQTVTFGYWDPWYDPLEMGVWSYTEPYLAYGAYFPYYTNYFGYSGYSSSVLTPSYGGVLSPQEPPTVIMPGDEGTVSRHFQRGRHEVIHHSSTRTVSKAVPPKKDSKDVSTAEFIGLTLPEVTLSQPPRLISGVSLKVSSNSFHNSADANRQLGLRNVKPALSSELTKPQKINQNQPQTSLSRKTTGKSRNHRRRR